MTLHQALVKEDLIYIGSDGAEAILTLVFTMKGVPMIYNGDEVADTAMLWNRFCCGSMSVQWHNLLTEQGKKRKEFVKKLIRIHHFNNAISQGNLVWCEENCDENVIAFERKSETAEIAVLVNTGRIEQKAELRKYGKVILSNNAKVDGNTAILDAYGALIIEY